MKKPLAALATTALAVLTTVGLATPASADTVVKLSTYFTASDIGQETGAGYPANEWFLSELSSTWTQGSVASSATGLDIDASGASTVVQLLNQGVVTPAEASGFLAAFGSMRVLASNQNWTLQLAIFGNGALGTEYTTLRPAATGPASASDPWITSGAIDNNGTTIAAGSTDTLTNFVNALYAGGTTPELLAYGIWVQNTTVSLYGTTAFADTSVFTPIPTRSITPNPATPAQAAAGLTISGAGWFPGAPVVLDVHDCDSYDSIATDDDGSTVADADGTFSIEVAFDAEPATGTYCYFLDDDDFLATFVMNRGTDLVIADAVVDEEDDEELAATGAQDATPWLIGAGALLLLGAAAVVLGARRRRNQH